MSNDQRRDAAMNAVIVAALILLNIGVAIVCFGVLSSSAEWSNGWALGGAIAGFAVSFVVTFGAYDKLRAASDGLNQEQQALRQELERTRADLAAQQEEGQRKLDELRGKLIRGAPRPKDFDVEVDERQRLVIARPQGWEPKGGIIFSYRATVDETQPDRFPATLQVSAAPLDPADAADLAGMYDRIRQRESNSSAGVPLVAETVQLGSDREDGVRSLRVLSRAYVEIDLTQGKKLDYRVIPYVDYAARIRGYAEDLLEAAGMKRFGDLQEQLEFSRAAEPLAAELDRQFSSGELRATDDHALETGPDGPRIVTVTRSAAAPTPGGPDPAVQGAAIVGGQSDRGPSDALGALRGITRERRIAVSPVGRVRVFCAHQELETLFEFDFVDDIVDFTNSTAQFDSIMRSVRFLI